MTIQSFTGSVSTGGIFKTINEVTGLTLTQGKMYIIQIQNLAYIKVANAIFPLINEKFYFTQGSENIYIKTNATVAVLTVLENEDS